MAGLAVIVAFTLWHLVIQHRWSMRLDGVGAVRAGLWALGGFTLSTSLVFAFGWLLS